MAEFLVKKVGRDRAPGTAVEQKSCILVQQRAGQSYNEPGRQGRTEKVSHSQNQIVPLKMMNCNRLVVPTAFPNCIAMEVLCGQVSTSVKSLALQILHHPPPHTHTHFVTSHKKWHHQPGIGKAQLSKTRVNKLAPPNMKRQWSRETKSILYISQI